MNHNMSSAFHLTIGSTKEDIFKLEQILTYLNTVYRLSDIVVFADLNLHPEDMKLDTFT